MPDARDQDKSQHIDESKDGENQYIIHPEDNDLFVRTGRQVIASCQLGISIEVWVEELYAMMSYVRNWARRQDARVRACYCTPRMATVVFFFAPRSLPFDFDLADSLADLNLDLIRRFNIGGVAVHQVPWYELDRFVDPDTNRLIYGEHFKSSPTMEA